LTEKLNIRYPIIQAGMAGGPTTPELIASVSNAGGLGMLGAGYMTAEKIEDAIKKIRLLTDRPFGINLFVPETPEWNEEKIRKSNEMLRPIREKLNLPDPGTIARPDPGQFLNQMEVVLESDVPVCAFTFGIPEKKIVERLKNRGIAVIGTATTADEAILNEKAGMDMVVAQGSEAGGHRGSFAAGFEMSMIGTMALVPQVADQVGIPVIAAGGIMDGRGVLAALVLGAQAVQMGTAFLACSESGAGRLYKEALLQSVETETTITSGFSGKPARGIQNAFIRMTRAVEDQLPDYPIQNALTRDIRQAAANRQDPEWQSMWSGQGIRLISEGSAADLIGQIISDVEKISKSILSY
jgi:nitronate monooxygenase